VFNDMHRLMIVERDQNDTIYYLDGNIFIKV